MSLITLENIYESYGEKVLFKDITFSIDEGEKVGLIGVNGVGKSTFLKVIAGFKAIDSGKITTASGIRIEYLPQSPEFDDEATVLEQIFKGTSLVMTLIRDYELTLEELAKVPEDSRLQKKLMQLNQRMDAENAWQIESEAKNILTKFGIINFSEKIGNLSGGQRKRVAMASALITPADLLILDEPTNHIDNESVDWLEEYLNRRRGALIMVTHDRYFLDRVTNRIMELDGGKLYSYKGNYSDYLKAKLEREEQLAASERKRQSLLRSELEWIKRGAKARSTKQKARIERFEKLQEEKFEVNNEKVEMSSVSSRLGKKVIELKNVSKVFEYIKCIENFDYILLRNDRIGIIGPNGSGKSTFMNILSGNLLPDSGSIEFGDTVKIGYFSQENENMDETLRVIDYIKEKAEFITLGEGYKISASQMLERFLFPPEVQYTLISKLSGGEKRRLYLLGVLIGAPNVLLLDEPTNDLDIQTLTILEDYLDNFEGAVVAVSHDRYFLDRVAEKLFVFKNNGVIEKYIGSYSDYIESDKYKGTEDEEKKEAVVKNEASQEKKEKPLKFTYKEKLEYEQIDDLIMKQENRIDDINSRINEAGSNYELLQELLLQKQEADDELEKLIERWSYLNELAEKIEKNNFK